MSARDDIGGAGVEIQVLRINGEPVTLATFYRITRDDEITGRPLGWVEYHRADWGCGSVDHRHVVWQHDDGGLRQAIVNWDPYNPTNESWFLALSLPHIYIAT